MRRWLNTAGTSRMQVLAGPGARFQGALLLEEIRQPVDSGLPPNRAHQRNKEHR